MRGTANIKIRPLKLALLVDPNNAPQVREAIRLASSLWGGMFFPIIPLHKRMPNTWREKPFRTPAAKDVVGGYIEAFDPDLLVQFSADLPQYITDSRLQVIKPQDVWGTMASDERLGPLVGISVLELLKDVFDEFFKYTPKYPIKVIVPKIPKAMGLFWASVFGEYPAHISSAVESYFSEPLAIERPKATPGAFVALTDGGVLFPRRITEWGLTKHGGALRFGRHACIYFMDATSIEDVIDYWNLRATGRVVLPLPKQFLQEESFRDAVEEFLVQERRAWPHDPKHFDVASIVRSRHSTMAEMESYARTLKFTKSPGIDPETRYYGLQHWYPRIWDEWARGKDGGVVDVYGTGEDSIEIEKTSDLDLRLKPLLPKFAEEETFHHSDGRCANELDLRLYGTDELLAEVYPKSHGDHLANAISGITSQRGEWRIGRHGLVKLVRNSWTESRTVPSSEKIFFAWLEDHGWKAQLSPPGILAKQIYKRLNGFVRLLTNKSLFGLLEHMNGGSVRKNGAPGVANSFVAEREISVGEVKKRLKVQSGRAGLYETLLQKGVFKLGLRTKCPNCQRHSWFALATLGESIECPKCLNSFPATGNIDQASDVWYYRTAGPFSVPNYADGAYAVLLTLDAIGDRMFSFSRTTSVPSFIASSSGKRTLEADFAMFWKEMSHGEERDGLLFGECKTYGLFEAKDLERMHYLAATFPGSVLVFSTLRETLTTKEISALKRLAKLGRKRWKAERSINPLLILTGTELLHWQRPPFCWSEDDQKRFRHIDGLLSLCDATQQRYLNLPPLHEEWHKHWERRNERRKVRDARRGNDRDPAPA